MNKWQIICPISAIAIVVVVCWRSSAMSHRRHYISAQTRMIGKELIATTNSHRLVGLGPGLQERLSRFLSSPSSVAEVKLSDEPAPIGDGTACSRLILSNAIGEKIGIRLRQDSEPERFYVLNFWTLQSVIDPTANK